MGPLDSLKIIKKWGIFFKTAIIKMDSLDGVEFDFNKNNYANIQIRDNEERCI